MYRYLKENSRLKASINCLLCTSNRYHKDDKKDNEFGVVYGFHRDDLESSSGMESGSYHINPLECLDDRVKG